MNIALGLAFCLVAVAVLKGAAELSVDHLDDNNELTEIDEEGYLAQELETPSARRIGSTFCRRKLMGRCVRKKKPCPNHLSSQTSPGKPYCAKFHRCCHSETLSPEGFMFKFHKKYHSMEERTKRISIFQDNVNFMKEHNKLYDLGKSSYLMGVDEYSDLTFEEEASQLMGIDTSAENRILKQASSVYVPKDLGKEPASLDYRNKGAVTSVTSQGGCNSCWAFSTIGSLEGAIAKKTGSLVKLSEMDLVDCYKKSCGRAWPSSAQEHIAFKGIATRKDYPYDLPGKDEDYTCNKDVRRTYPMVGRQRVRAGNETELLNALVHHGPISIVAKWTKNSKGYSKGVLFDEICVEGEYDLHAMTLVGYGTEKGLDYWLVKNSHGKSRGEKGYIKYARNKDNHCKIASWADMFVLKEDAPLPDKINYMEGLQYNKVYGEDIKGKVLIILRASYVPSGFCSLGDVAITDNSKPTPTNILVASGSSAVAHPYGVKKVWKNSGSDAKSWLSVYTMIPPYGYTCLGGIAMGFKNKKPNMYDYCCIHNDYLVPGDLVQTYNETGTSAKEKLSLWTILKGSDKRGIESGNWLPVNGHDKPSGGDLLNNEKTKKVGTSLPDEIKYINGLKYEQIWNTEDSGSNTDLSIWRAEDIPSGYCSLGDVAITGYSKPTERSIFVASGSKAVGRPIKFTKIWTDKGSGAKLNGAIYTMIAPYGYTCLGGVAMGSHDTEPNKDRYCCFHKDYLVPGNVVQTWNETGTGANEQLSLWTIVNGSDKRGMAGGHFLPVNGHDKPSDGLLLNEERAKKVNTTVPDKIKYKEGFKYEQIWTDKGSGAATDLSIWGADDIPSGFCSLGDMAVVGHYYPHGTRSILVASGSSAVAQPIKFTKIWKDAGTGADEDVAVYTMIAPQGYTCLGGVAIGKNRKEPNKYNYCCIHNEFLVPGNVVQTWNETGSGAKEKLSLWTIVKGTDNSGMEGGNFLPVKSHDKPSNGFLLNSDKAQKENKYETNKATVHTVEEQTTEKSFMHSMVKYLEADITHTKKWSS